MEQRAPTTPTTARAMLVEWANQQDGWVRALVAEVMSTQGPLSDAAAQSVFERYLIEKGLADGEQTPVGPLVLPEARDAEGDNFRLLSLSNVARVNALATDQTIEFNPALTVLFGENGAGKTGYTRILKRLAAVRTAEDILGDVHATEIGDPQATITYVVSDDEKQLDWQGDEGVPPFTSVSIFDSPAVTLHVDDDLSYVYTPADLALFPHVTAGVESVRKLLDDRRAATRPSSNPFLPLFSRDSDVYPAIETLGATTDLDVLRKLADVPEGEAETLPSLEARVEALRANTIPAQITVAKGTKECYGSLGDAARAFARFDAEAYNQAIVNAENAEAAYVAARAELFSAAGLDGEGDESWQAFILAGDAYRDHQHLDEYPTSKDACLYCRQRLDTQAIDLLRRYRTFAADESRKRIEEAKALAATLSREIVTLDLSALGAALGREREAASTDEVLTRATDFVSDALQLQETCRSQARLEPVTVTEISALAAAADGRVEVASKTVAELEAKSSERATALATATKEYAQLKDRLTLKARLESVVQHVESAKWDSRAGTLATRIPSVLRSLTETAKVASQDLLNTDFEARFQEECRVLRAPNVLLEFPGRRGQSARRKKVTSYKPSAVLSEGEQKVIALADFLAEAALRLTSAPLVFDDPVNSLDYRRIHEVADRVAALAGERQVIVFTHNIWFATELLARFESDTTRCTYYSITDDTAKGVVSQGSHPRWDTLKKTKGRVNDVLQSAQSSDGEVRDALIERGYSLIRTWCEIAVETELLAGVTQRYQANVSMTKLPQIKGANLDAATQIILPIFEKACRIMDGHSQPLETLAVRPTIEDFNADWAALQQALAEYKANS